MFVTKLQLGILVLAIHCMPTEGACPTKCICDEQRKVRHVSITSGGSRGRQGCPLSIKILSFSCSFRQKFCKIIGWRNSLGSLAPPGKS